MTISDRLLYPINQSEILTHSGKELFYAIAKNSPIDALNIKKLLELESTARQKSDAQYEQIMDTFTFEWEHNDLPQILLKMGK